MEKKKRKKEKLEGNPWVLKAASAWRYGTKRIYCLAYTMFPKSCALNRTTVLEGKKKKKKEAYKKQCLSFWRLSYAVLQVFKHMHAQESMRNKC